MMILTDYYMMQEIKVLKSHRLDCIASTGEYLPFESIAQRARDKRFFLYYNGVPDTFSMDAKRKADRAITNGDNISSVFIPDLENQLQGYGDTKGTNDALLFLFSRDYKQLEIFIARGYKNDVKGLFDLFADGELDADIEALREKVIKSVTDEE
jgi:hypothetical protein